MIRGVISQTAQNARQAIAFIERDPDPFAKLISHTFPVTEAERANRVTGGETDESSFKVAIDPTA